MLVVQKYNHDGSKMLLQIGTKGLFDSSTGLITGIAMNRSKTLLNKPADIAVDPTNGDIYIADGYGDHRIVVFDKDGKFLRQWGEQATNAESAAGEGGKFMGVVHCVVMDKAGPRVCLRSPGQPHPGVRQDGQFQEEASGSRATRKKRPIRGARRGGCAFRAMPIRNT